MKLPRDLSGPESVKLLCKHYDYVRIHQEGSHVILQTETPRHHRISVPNHSSLRVGTLTGILNAVAKAKGISKGDILEKL